MQSLKQNWKWVGSILLFNLLLGNFFLFNVFNRQEGLVLSSSYSIVAILLLSFTLSKVRGSTSMARLWISSFFITLLVPALGTAIVVSLIAPPFFENLGHGFLLGGVVGAVGAWFFYLPMFLLNTFLFYFYKKSLCKKGDSMSPSASFWERLSLGGR